MKLCKYWAVAEGEATDAKGRRLKLRKWGGSNDSREGAAAQAKSALDELLRRVAALDIRGDQAHYAYSMRDVPEELLRTISDGSGVTRNGKGCEVLNTTEAFFADIDIRGPGFFARLFGATRQQEEEKRIAVLKNWLAQNPGAGARIYRTKAGLRYLFTHAPLAVNEETLGWLTGLGSDKLYVRLCRNQKCYRARLTPKPFRIGCPRISGHYPFDTADSRTAFDGWLDLYRRNSQGYAVCDFVATEGDQRIHPSLFAIVKEHDTATRCGSGLPLA